MNKKLIVLIVALECVFSIFLISIFGPMIESLHSKIVVQDVYFVDDAGVRMEEEASVLVDLSEKRSFHFDFEVVTEEATDRTVDILHNCTDDEIEILEDADGFGLTVTFLSSKIPGVRIVVRARDSGQKQAALNIVVRDDDVNIGDDFLD